MFTSVKAENKRNQMPRGARSFRPVAALPTLSCSRFKAAAGSAGAQGLPPLRRLPVQFLWLWGYFTADLWNFCVNSCDVSPSRPERP